MDMEQKKARKRPNFFDLLIVILLLLVVAAAYWLSHRSAAPTAVVIPRTYMVELIRLQEGMEEYVAVGDPVTDNVKNYDVGTVKAVEVLPYTTGESLDEEAGMYRQAPVEGWVNVLLTVEVDTVETDSTVDTLSGYTLRTGATGSFTAGTLSSRGVILDVSR